MFDIVYLFSVASCAMGTGSFLGVKSSRGVTLTPHPPLVPWSRKGRSIPLLPLWAIQPVQSLGACRRVHFTLPFTYFLYIVFSSYGSKFSGRHSNSIIACPHVWSRAKTEQPPSGCGRSTSFTSSHSCQVPFQKTTIV